MGAEVSVGAGVAVSCGVGVVVGGAWVTEGVAAGSAVSVGASVAVEVGAISMVVVAVGWGGKPGVGGIKSAGKLQPCNKISSTRPVNNALFLIIPPGSS